MQFPFICQVKSKQMNSDLLKLKLVLNKVTICTKRCSCDYFLFKKVRILIAPLN